MNAACFEEEAREIAARICATARVKPPRIVVQYRCKGRNSSGKCYYGSHVALMLGYCPIDRRGVLLHELAHWLTGAKRTSDFRQSHHPVRFWRKCLDLYEQDELLMDNLHFLVLRDCSTFAGFAREAARRGWLTDAESRFTSLEWRKIYWRVFP